MSSLNKRIFSAVILFIGFCYIILASHKPYTGDDLVYGPMYTTRYHGFTDYLVYVAQHWLSTNGRIADKISPLFLNFTPRWIFLTVNAAITALMFAIVVKLACTQRVGLTARLLLVSLIVFTLPWWDSMLLFACSFNYVWASTFGLYAIYFILNKKANMLLVIFSFIAAGMHEAMGLPLSCGLIAYFFFTRAHKSMPTIQRLSVLAFFAGSAFTLLSRALWCRLNSITEVNDPMPILVLKSDFFVLALIVLIIVAYFVSRKRLIKAIYSPWILFVVAALASCCISAVSGIVGRSGWFAQLYALIAIYMWFDSCDWHISRRCGIAFSTIMIAAIVFHFTEFTRYQVISGNQLAECIEQYSKSDDGIVYGDYLGDPEKPWWILHKSQGVPDADDLWILSTITKVYGDESHPITILPTAFRNIDAHAVSGMMPIGSNFVSDAIPQGTSQRMFYRLNNKDYVVVPFKKDNVQLYFITPLDLDPGDR